MSNQADEIERLLAELRALIAQSRATPEQVPLVLDFPAAAKRLGVGLTKLKEIVRSGELLTTEIGSRQMVPVSELERIATPTERRAPIVRRQQLARWVPIAKKAKR